MKVFTNIHLTIHTISKEVKSSIDMLGMYISTRGMKQQAIFIKKSTFNNLK
jgi:hypothetical protein